MTTYKIRLEGDAVPLLEGMGYVAGNLGVEIGDGGILVRAEQAEAPTLEVVGEGAAYTIRFSQRAYFFRGLGLLCESLRDGKTAVTIRETPRFTMNGAMYDVSQGNAVMRVSTVKEILRRMAVMGLNMIMLYVEDSYDLEGEPYFGYMRSRYTQVELREMDDYAFALGVEMIPCIQTLAHLIDALKWPVYRGMHEDDDTLFVGEERVYEFIERMIVQSAAPVRTRRMHIGMDEAWKLGQGDYLLRHGLRSKLDIMNEHLGRVAEICRKHGVKPMIWSDMYFRAASATGSYYDAASAIPAAISDAAPHDVQLVYWDYYHDEPEFYLEWLRRHAAFKGGTVFAGGMWNWTGFGMNWGKTLRNTDAALAACKRAGCKEVFMTVWGDDHTESSVYTTLLGLQLYAEHGFCEVLDTECFRKRATFCIGLDAGRFESISHLNEVPGVPEGNPNNFNPAKILMWQNLLAGLFDADIKELDLTAHYAKWAAIYEEAAEEGDAYGLMEFSARVARVLELKADLGKTITRAYGSGDKAKLRVITGQTLPLLKARAEALRDWHRGYWMKTMKPLGWEVLDLRYGALLAGIDTAAFRLNAWLDGKIEAIEELEEPRRRYFTGRLREVNAYGRIASASRISCNTRYS